MPWFAMRSAHPEAPPITIRHLLTHTAGLPREAGLPYWTDGRFPEREELPALIAGLAPVLPSETRWKYTNLGPTLSGEVVAAVSGQPYARYVREPILEPDALLIQDPTLLHQVDVFAGLVPDGYVLINTTRSLDELGLAEFLGRFRRDRIRTVAATELALKHVGRPVPNAALLAGFAATSGRISLDSVIAAIRDRFPAKVADANVAAAQEAYDSVMREMQGAGHAQAD